jgi:hypothetical protein
LAPFRTTHLGKTSHPRMAEAGRGGPPPLALPRLAQALARDLPPKASVTPCADCKARSPGLPSSVPAFGGPAPSSAAGAHAPSPPGWPRPAALFAMRGCGDRGETLLRQCGLLCLEWVYRGRVPQSVKALAKFGDGVAWAPSVGLHLHLNMQASYARPRMPIPVTPFRN